MASATPPVIHGVPLPGLPFVLNPVDYTDLVRSPFPSNGPVIKQYCVNNATGEIETNVYRRDSELPQTLARDSVYLGGSPTFIEIVDRNHIIGKTKATREFLGIDSNDIWDTSSIDNYFREFNSGSGEFDSLRGRIENALTQARTGHHVGLSYLS